MAKVEIDFKFDDDWARNPDGTIATMPVIGAQTAYREDVVMFRFALVTNLTHLEAISTGKTKPVVLHYRFLSPTEARRFASALEASADLAEGKKARLSS